MQLAAKKVYISFIPRGRTAEIILRFHLHVPLHVPLHVKTL